MKFDAACVVFGMLVSCVLFASTSHADLIDYSVVKARGFNQTADNTAPAGPFGYAFEAFVQADPGDFTSISLGGATTSPVAFTDVGGGAWEIFEFFPTKPPIDAAYPSSNIYTIDASGPLGTFSESITLGPDDYPSPGFFTGTVFSDLQGMDASQDFDLTWTTPPAPGDVTVIVEDATTLIDDFVISGNGLTSATIFGGTLTPGTTYDIFLQFEDLPADITESFDTGGGQSGHLTATFFSFTTAAVPEPSSWALLTLASLGFGGYKLRKRKGKKTV